jgi:hypothetical protein
MALVIENLSTLALAIKSARGMAVSSEALARRSVA